MFGKQKSKKPEETKYQKFMENMKNKISLKKRISSKKVRKKQNQFEKTKSV